MRQSRRQAHTIEVYGAHEAIDDLLSQIEIDCVQAIESKKVLANVKDKIALVKRAVLLLAAHDLPTRGTA